MSGNIFKGLTQCSYFILTPHEFTRVTVMSLPEMIFLPFIGTETSLEEEMSGVLSV